MRQAQKVKVARFELVYRTALQPGDPARGARMRPPSQRRPDLHAEAHGLLGLLGMRKGPPRNYGTFDLTRNWIDHRSSRARVLDRPNARTCTTCGCITDESDPAHSPRCKPRPGRAT
jgi:hypothetical protein